MLPEGFYTILHQHSEEESIQARIALNSEHEIFKGHFPNNPVTPGVCMLQIFKEIAQIHLQKKLQISECSNVKFMAIINPQIHPQLDLNLQLQSLEENTYKIKAVATFDQTTAIKLSLVLKSKE